MNVYLHYRNENDYDDLDQKSAIGHLSEAIRFKTVSYVDRSRIDCNAFEDLHAFLERSYPNIRKKGKWQYFGQSLLICIKGEDKKLAPALLMAHQDVVPVSDSIGQWSTDPFSGLVSKGYIWGRGTLDIKNMLVGIMEACEYVLAHGHRFRRTLYLAFGEDEETANSGSYRIAEYLKQQGIHLEYVLDESGKWRDGSVYGAPDVMVSEIGMYEKGYADIKLKTQARGGHSSNPFHGTSLGLLCQSVAAVLDMPLEAKLLDCHKQALKILAPYIKEEPMASYVKDIRKNEKKIIGYYLEHEDLYNQITTTKAPTMITPGSPAGNVMPQDMEAVINFRLSPQDSVESLSEAIEKAINKQTKIADVRAIGASEPGDPASYGFQEYKKVLEHYFEDMIFIPAVNTAATDARNYERVCNCCMRFGPFLEDMAIKNTGVHGVDERISERAYIQGIRVLIALIEKTC